MERFQLDSFLDALISLRHEIEQLNKDSRDAAGTLTLDQSMRGLPARIDAFQALHVARETARRRQRQLRRIDSALRRMESGENCYCLICGDDIDPARLDFDPASTRCTRCMDD